MQDMVLLQTFLGLSIAIGVMVSGSTINKTFEISFRKIRISRQYVCQGCVILISLSMLILSAVSSYRGLCVGVRFGLGWLSLFVKITGDRTCARALFFQSVGIHQNRRSHPGFIRSAHHSIFERCILSIRKGRVLHLLGCFSDIGHRYVLYWPHRSPRLQGHG